MSENDHTEEKQSTRRWACATHLGAILGVMTPFAPAILPVLIWYFKRGQNPYIEEHGRRSVNFQLSLCIYYAVAAVIVWGLKLVLVGYLVFWLPGIIHYTQVLLPLVAALRAYEGDDFDYPFTLVFLKPPSQSNTPEDAECDT